MSISTLSPNDQLLMFSALLSCHAKDLTNNDVCNFLSLHKKFSRAGGKQVLESVLLVPESFDQGMYSKLHTLVVKHLFNDEVFPTIHTLTKPIMEGLVTLSMVFDGLNVTVTVADLEHIDKLHAILGKRALEQINISGTKPVLVIEVGCEEHPVCVKCDIFVEPN